jgi:hypothetical protein
MALLSVHVLSSTLSNAAGPAPSSSSFFSGSQGDFQVHSGLVVFGFFVWCLSTVCDYYKPVHSLPRFSQASCQFLSGLWVLYFSDGFSFFFLGFAELRSGSLWFWVLGFCDLGE